MEDRHSLLREQTSKGVGGHIHCLLSVLTNFHIPCGEWCGEKERGPMTICHKPLKYMVGRAGIEPATLCLKGYVAFQIFIFIHLYCSL